MYIDIRIYIYIYIYIPQPGVLRKAQLVGPGREAGHRVDVAADDDVGDGRGGVAETPREHAGGVLRAGRAAVGVTGGE